MLLEFQSSAFDRSATSPVAQTFACVGSEQSQALRAYARAPHAFAPGEFVDRSVTFPRRPYVDASKKFAITNFFWRAERAP
jgi:hypothetical protein